MRITIINTIFTVFIALAFTISATATNYHTDRDGKWSKNNTWISNSDPGTWIGNSDSIFVDHNIELDKHVEIAGVVVISATGSINGNRHLSINTGGKIISEGDIRIKRLNVWGGSLTTSSDMEVSQHINTSNSAIIDVGGNFESGGNVQLNNTTINVGGNFDVDGGFTMNSTNVDVGGDISVLNSSNLNNASDLLVHGKGDFDNHVILNWNSVMEVMGGQSSVGGKLTLNGGTLTIADEFVIAGQTIINGGSELNNNGTLTSNNKLELNSSGVLNNNGTVTTNGTFSNGGTVTNSGTWTANNDFINNWGGVYNNTGDIVVNDDVTNRSVLSNDGSIESSGDMLNDWGSSYVNNGSTFIDGDINNNGTMDGSGTTLVTGTLDTQGGTVTGDGYVCNPDQTTDPTGGDPTNVDPNVTICGATDDDPFPVELVEFEAKAENNAVELTWTTASEINNDYFTVQRAVENGNFEDIATIGGAGNSNELINYSFVDYTCPDAESVYYRIKQTDFDGTASWSWIIDVKNKKDIVMEVYPNPVDRGEAVTIQSSAANTVVSAYDVQGNQIISGRMDQNKFKLYTSNLKPGMYFIRINSENGSEPVTKKLIIR